MGIWDLRYRYPDRVRVQGKTLIRTGVRINMQAMPNQKENPLYSKVSKSSAQKKKNTISVQPSGVPYHPCENIQRC